jgi:uncharacterized membrane protein YfcA
MSAKDILLITLGGFAVLYFVAVIRGQLRARRVEREAAAPPNASTGAIATGFVTNFFDTLGIGSFATTTSIFRQWRMVRDELIPGTLNVGHAFGAILQAFIYTKIVPVEARTLILMIAAAVAGAWLGAGVVTKWPRRRIQMGMGFCLLAAAGIMLLSQMQLVPGGGEALALTGPRLMLGIAGNFILGALMTLGIGLYAPCLILVSLLGMNPTAAFPIMMGSCAFLMPIATARFVREGKYHPGVSLGLLIGSIPAVFIAAYIVKSLPLAAVRYLVVIVVLYTAVMLLRTAVQERRQLQAAAPATK